MTTLAVVGADPNGPVVRHRIRALEPALREAGFDAVEIHAMPRRVRERLSLFGRLGAADLVVLQRKLFTAAELKLLRRAVPRLVYDLDDAVMFRDPSRHRPVSRVRRGRFKRTVRAADLVTAGNAYLLGFADEDAPDTRSILAPTPIDADRYAPGEGSGRGFRIGWIGSSSTRWYLERIVQALAQVTRVRSDAVVAVMADAPPELPGVPMEFTPWSADAEVAFLRSLHVGVMPLTDDPFSRGKCGFKLLQYMACGVPVVTSPVGVNREIVQDGRAGVLADGADEWESALERLADDGARRAELGALGRAAVEEHWSSCVRGPRFAHALAECAARVGP